MNVVATSSFRALPGAIGTLRFICGRQWVSLGLADERHFARIALGKRHRLASGVAAIDSNFEGEGEGDSSDTDGADARSER